MTFNLKHMAAVAMVTTGLVGGFWAYRAVTYQIRGYAVYWEPSGDNPASHVVKRESSEEDFKGCEVDLGSERVLARRRFH